MRSFTHARPGLFLLLLLLLCSSGLGLYSSSRRAAQAVSPRVWLSQKVGPSTASMQVHGTGFGLNETVLVDFDDTTQIGSTLTDATGRFVVRVMVPKTALPETHTVGATGQSSGLTALALFLLLMDWTQLDFGPYQTGYYDQQSDKHRETVVIAWKWTQSQAHQLPADAPDAGLSSTVADTVIIAPLGTNTTGLVRIADTSTATTASVANAAKYEVLEVLPVGIVPTESHLRFVYRRFR